MWLFNKRASLQANGVFNGFTDWHCHILPSVDDGVQTMEESLEILRRYEELGVKTVWLTPHIMEDVPNTTAHLHERFEELKTAYQGNIKIQLAAENMLDSLFEERMDKNDLMPIGENGQHLLVETSYFNPPMGMNNILLRIKQKGYYPILAHPERYAYMSENDYKQLKGLNILFQLNLFSLIGFYGSIVRKKATWLLDNGMYNLCGSDLHSIEYLNEPLLQKLKRKTTRQLQNILTKDFTS